MNTVVKRVLVVDDHAAVARAIVALLVHEGFVAEIASSGARALALAGSFQPHVGSSIWRFPTLSATRSPGIYGQPAGGFALWE